MDSPATTAALAEVIDLHTAAGYDGNVTCWCGRDFESWSAHSEHVATAVLHALGLTPEFTWSWPEQLTGTGSPGYGYGVGSREEAEAEATSLRQPLRCADSTRRSYPQATSGSAS